MFRSNNSYDPLTHCVVGRSYPEKFYSWIRNPRLRELFKQVARETEEDYRALIAKLNSFGVRVTRPNTWDMLPSDFTGKRIPGPYSMTPRDHMAMIGDTLYTYNAAKHVEKASGRAFDRDADWSELALVTDFYANVVNYAKKHGKVVTPIEKPWLNTVKANGIYRLDDTIIVGGNSGIDYSYLVDKCRKEFKEYENVKVVHSEGHVDGVLSVVKPGLVLSITDMDYSNVFPSDWEIVRLPGESWDKVDGWRNLKRANNGNWWIKGYEQDYELVDFVETWLQDWVGYVEETVFDVNILTIDPQNVIVSGYNEKAFDAFARHGVTPHIVPFRHRYFWDGGTHCITLDLNRESHGT